MRWINTLGIVPLAVVLAAVLARLSQLSAGRRRPADQLESRVGRR